MDLFDPVAGQEDALTLQEMIDCDIRSEFDGVLQGTNFSSQNQTMEVDSPAAAAFELDSDLSGSNHNMALIQQQTLYNVDFEPTGLLVNPQTGLPTQLDTIHHSHRASKLVHHPSPCQALTPKDPSSPLTETPVIKWPQHPVQAVTDYTVESNGKKEYPKPSYSYSCLIAMALKNSATGSLPVSEIYSFMMENFPYFKTAPGGWKNSVRHNLSLNKCFEKIEKPSATSASQRKGCLWALNPAKVNKMEEEVQKWSRKDPAAIKRSMLHPENFERLENGCTQQECVKSELTHLSTTQLSNTSLSAGVTFKIKRETIDAELDLLDTNIPLDTSLPDLNLQSGIWDELEDDQVQFGVSRKSDDHSAVSVTLTATTGSAADKFSECNSKASIQNNYIYSQAVNLNNNTNLSLSNNSNNAQLLSKRCKIMSALM